MSRYEVDPLLAVGLEGTFGLFTTAVAMPILHFFVSSLLCSPFGVLTELTGLTPLPALAPSPVRRQVRDV